MVKAGKLSRLIDAGLLNKVLVVLAFLNIVVVLIFELQREPKLIVEQHEIITNHVIVVTNFISSVDSTTSQYQNPSNHLKDVNIDIAYSYFLHNGIPCAKWYGRYFQAGSPTSYGRIKQVFPDRIELVSGAFLKNTLPPVEVDTRENERQLVNALTNQRIREIDERSRETVEVVPQVPFEYSQKYYQDYNNAYR